MGTHMHSSVRSSKVFQRFSNICKAFWLAHAFSKHVVRHRCAGRQFLVEFLQILSTARTAVFIFRPHRKHSANEIWISPNDLAHFPWRTTLLCTVLCSQVMEHFI